MERYHEFIPVLAEIRDRRLTDPEEKNVVNMCIGLVHEKVANSSIGQKYTPEQAAFVAENLHINPQLAEALIENGVITIYEDMSGTLANIFKVDEAASHIADSLPADAFNSESIKKEFAFMIMCLHLTRPM